MCGECLPTIFPHRPQVSASFLVCRAPTDDGSELNPDLMLRNSWAEKILKVIFGGLDRSSPSASGFSTFLGLLVMQDKNLPCIGL